MKKYLLLGLALILANGFTSARAQSCLNHATLANSSGSQPVVVGNAVQLLVAVPTNSIVNVYLDGNLAVTYYPTDKPVIVPTTLTVPYGSHTLQSGTCPAFTFSVEAPAGAPGTPTLSSNKFGLIGGGTYTLSWTVPSGSINHYTLSRVQNGNSPTFTTFPASSTSVTLTASSKPGTDNTIDFNVRACATADESDCSDWSNTVEVVVIN